MATSATKYKNESAKLDWNFDAANESLIDQFMVWATRVSQPAANPFQVVAAPKSARSVVLNNPVSVADTYHYWIVAMKGTKESDRSNSVDVLWHPEVNPGGNSTPPPNTALPAASNLRVS